MSRKSICRHCRQPVKVVRTRSGAQVALIPHPHPSGTYRLTRKWNLALGGKEDIAVPITPNEEARPAEEQKWIPHTAVCAHRRPTTGFRPPHVHDRQTPEPITKGD